MNTFLDHFDFAGPSPAVNILSPPGMNPEKFAALLRKQNNKFELVVDVFSEVKSFLDVNDISYVVNVSSNDPMKIIEIDKIVLFVVEDYDKFNTKVLHKKFVEDIHFKWTNNGYRVIWIKKFEWEDTRKRQVLQSLILHACGKTKTRIFARKTYAEVISNKQLSKFFSDSSFYGFRGASFAACLRDKETNEILMAMSFGHPYYGKNKYGENAVECIRAATKPFATVVGGMSKLMKFIIDQFGNEFDTMVYYVDDAHYNSRSMSSIGFTFSHFAGGASHNIWKRSGAMMMRTPAMHKEIMYMIASGEIVAVPDVGNSTYIFKKSNMIGNASSTDT